MTHFFGIVNNFYLLGGGFLTGGKQDALVTRFPGFFVFLRLYLVIFSYLCDAKIKSNMAQIDDFFFEANRVVGITDEDYQRAQPYVEAARAFAQTTYQTIYIIDYHRRGFLYVSDNPLFLCGHTADEVLRMG